MQATRQRAHQLRTELGLVFVKRIMHLPELTLCSGGFRRFRGKLRVRMHFVERHISKDEAKLRSKSLGDCLDHGIRVAAIRAFVIPVFDQSHRRRCGTLDMIIFADRNGQAHAGLRGNASSALKIPSAPGLTPTGDTKLHWIMPSLSMTNS